MKEKIRIGCGAGFSGDRFDAALKLVRDGNLDYLVLECLAERTIAIANKTKLADHSKGFDPLLERRMYSLLPDLIVNKVRLITNMGAANPLAAGKIICEIAKKLSLSITYDLIPNCIAGSISNLNESPIYSISFASIANLSNALL